MRNGSPAALHSAVMALMSGFEGCSATAEIGLKSVMPRTLTQHNRYIKIFLYMQRVE